EIFTGVCVASFFLGSGADVLTSELELGASAVKGGEETVVELPSFRQFSIPSKNSSPPVTPVLSTPSIRSQKKLNNGHS
ncbi:hypothetical protein N9Z99_05945, partial [Akkermansiaceae bacterium]|nr:hypothetical protein [Akkermansiaceae bacterium]